MDAFETWARRQGTVSIIILTALFAVIINLAIYGIATFAGATFDFTDKGEAYHVYALTLIGFTAIPLLAGLTALAILGRWWRVLYAVAIVIAPIIAIATIFTMTIPADLDSGSTAALAAAHIVVGICAAGGSIALRALVPRSTFRFA